MPARRTYDVQSQSLEVTIDTPQNPKVAIISPTPQAFTFPTSNDTPYSPSSSPFESHVRQPTLSYTPSPPPLVRTMSPTSPSSSISSAASFPATPRTTHKRRKSTSEAERRPKRGDEDYIKRPENAFILFRRKCVEERQAETSSAAAAAAAEGAGVPKKQRQAVLSKLISHQWKSLSPEERLYWEDLAKQRKKEHEQMYPDYVYRPQRTKDRKKKGLKTRRIAGTQEETAEPEAPQDTEQATSTPTPTQSISRRRSQSTPAPPATLPPSGVEYAMDSPSAVPQADMHVDPYGPNSQGMAWPPSIFLDTSYGPPDMMYNPGPLGDSMFGMPAPANDASFQDGTFNPLSVCTDPSLLMAPNGFASPVASCTSSTSDLVSPLDETFSLPGMAGNFPLPNEMYSPVVHGPESYVHDGSKPDYAMQAFQYAPCWQDPSLFSSNEMLFSSDFDVNNVPSVELGLPKMNENSVAFPSHYGSLDGQGQYTEFSQPGQHHNADAMGGPYARIFHDYHDDTGHY